MSKKDKVLRLYYEQKYGYYPDDYKDSNEYHTLRYLIDNKIYNIEELYGIINNTKDKKAKNLPKLLWKNSLLEQNKYYHHRLLHIKPPMVLGKKLEFYLEIRISFTEKDIVDYFYKKSEKDIMLRDENKDIGAVRYLLNKYSILEDISSIDFILTLIDFMQKDRINEIVQLADYENEVLSYLRRKVKNSKNKIIWRGGQGK